MPKLPKHFKELQENDLSIRQASEFLNVSTKTLRRWETKEILKPSRTLGGHRRYSFEVIKKFKEVKGVKRIRPSVKVIISQPSYSDSAIKPAKPQIPEIYQKLPSVRQYLSSLHFVQKRVFLKLKAFWCRKYRYGQNDQMFFYVCFQLPGILLYSN